MEPVKSEIRQIFYVLHSFSQGHFTPSFVSKKYPVTRLTPRTLDVDDPCLDEGALCEYRDELVGLVKRFHIYKETCNCLLQVKMLASTHRDSLGLALGGKADWLISNGELHEFFDQYFDVVMNKIEKEEPSLSLSIPEMASLEEKQKFLMEGLPGDGIYEFLFGKWFLFCGRKHAMYIDTKNKPVST
jgi:hypothetical protein